MKFDSLKKGLGVAAQTAKTIVQKGKEKYDEVDKEELKQNAKKAIQTAKEATQAVKDSPTTKKILSQCRDTAKDIKNLSFDELCKKYDIPLKDSKTPKKKVEVEEKQGK